MSFRTRFSVGLLALSAPACCIAAQSRVRTTVGLRAAGSLVVGDRVIAIDVTTGRLVEREIVEVRRATRECLALRWRDGALVCTADHPLYAPDRRAWRPASDWVTGGARHLLACVGEALEEVEVEAVEPFVGVHEVVDISLSDEPRNFIAEGVLVHNKTPAVPYDPVEYLTVEEDGPAFTLEAPGDARRFRIHVCLDGDDFPRGNLDVYADPSTSAQLAGEKLWLSLESSTNLNGPFADTIPAPFFGFHDDLPGDACSEGFVVTFEHVQGPDGAEITVAWEVTVTTDHDIETPGMSLEVSIEPED